MTQAELQLVLQAREGDRAAFGQLIASFKGRVYATAMAVSGDPEEARELTQETFVRAMQNLPRLETPERFGAWLGGITRTLAKDVRRKAAREKRHLQAAAHERGGVAEPADAAVARRETSEKQLELLLDLVSGLPENTRIALDLRFRRDLSYAEIAEEMGVPASTVRGLLHRGTKALRTKLRPMLRRAGEMA